MVFYATAAIILSRSSNVVISFTAKTVHPLMNFKSRKWKTKKCIDRQHLEGRFKALENC